LGVRLLRLPKKKEKKKIRREKKNNWTYQIGLGVAFKGSVVVGKVREIRKK
jgi:hypothetical protein